MLWYFKLDICYDNGTPGKTNFANMPVLNTKNSFDFIWDNPVPPSVPQSGFLLFDIPEKYETDFGDEVRFKLEIKDYFGKWYEFSYFRDRLYLDGCHPMKHRNRTANSYSFRRCG